MSVYDVIIKVREEKQDLDDKLIRLREFIYSPAINKLANVHRSLLESQMHVMNQYSGILAERLKHLEHDYDSEDPED